jgi:hypothetical protein
MDNTFRWMPYNNDQRIAHNVETISKFPRKDSAQAQYNKQLLPGSDDLPEMSKERVPHQALTEFTKLVNCFGKDLPPVMAELEKHGCSQEDPLEMAKLYGIAYMTLFVKAALKLPRLPAQVDLDKFYYALPNLDHMDKRTGKEVYIAKEDLATLLGVF